MPVPQKPCRGHPGWNHSAAAALVVMSPAFYRREATRYRLMAGQEADPLRADQFRRMAAESDDLADDMEHDPGQEKPN